MRWLGETGAVTPDPNNGRNSRRTRMLYTLIAFALIAAWWIIPARLLGTIILDGCALVAAALLVVAVMWSHWRRTASAVDRWWTNLRSNPRCLRRFYRTLTVTALVLCTTHLIGAFIAPRMFVTHKKTLTPGLVYGLELWNGCTVHTLAVDLNQIDPIILRAPAQALGRRSLLELASAEPKRPVIAAVNGDYFDEGGSQGLLVSSSGRFFGPRRDRSALCFRQTPLGQSRAEVDIFRFTSEARVEVADDAFQVCSYNTSYIGGVGVYTPARGVASGAGSCKPMIQARVSLVNSQEGDADLIGEVAEVDVNPTSNLIPGNGEVILTAGNPPGLPADLGPYAWGKERLVKGAWVSIHLPITPKPGTEVISGGPQFLNFGHYTAREEGNGSLLTHTGRTAVGISRDGRYLLVVVAEGSPKIASVPPREVVDDLLKLHLRDAGSSIWANAGQFASWSWFHLWADVVGVSHLSSGMDMRDMARYMAHHSVFGQRIHTGLNLDGGESSSMVLARGDKTFQVSAQMENQARQLATGLGFVPRMHSP